MAVKRTIIDTEREETIRLANKLMDEPNCDPDDDLRMLSRQFLRCIEKLQDTKAVLVRWHDDQHPPEVPGLYYWETIRPDNNWPSPGLYLWEEGKEPKFPKIKPWKMFGPITGAMKPGPTATGTPI